MRLLAAAVVIVGCIAYTAKMMAQVTSSGPNPEIFPAFRAIEADCAAEAIPTVRCAGVMKQMRICADGCTAAEYYCAVDRLGFDLPAYAEGRATAPGC